MPTTILCVTVTDFDSSTCIVVEINALLTKFRTFSSMNFRQLHSIRKHLPGHVFCNYCYSRKCECEWVNDAEWTTLICHACGWALQNLWALAFSVANICYMRYSEYTFEMNAFKWHCVSIHFVSHIECVHIRASVCMCVCFVNYCILMLNYRRCIIQTSILLFKWLCIDWHAERKKKTTTTTTMAPAIERAFRYIRLAIIYWNISSFIGHWIDGI